MKQDEQKQQEMIYKFAMFEQQIQNLQQQIQAVEHAIVDMNSLNMGLDELKGSEGKEILAPVGRGIFAKTKLISENLIVDIGGRNFVGKNIPETKILIQKQIKKLESIKRELEENLEQISGEIQRIYQESQGDVGE